MSAPKVAAPTAHNRHVILAQHDEIAALRAQVSRERIINTELVIARDCAEHAAKALRASNAELVRLLQRAVQFMPDAHPIYEEARKALANAKAVQP